MIKFIDALRQRVEFAANRFGDVFERVAHALSEPGHWITAMSPQFRCQILAKLIATRGADLPQVLTTEGAT